MTPARAPLLYLGHLSSPLDSEDIRGLGDPLCTSCKTLVENLLKLYVFGAQSLHTNHKNACWCR